MMEEQNPRISFTLSYKGIVVGGMNDYHPEKVDFSVTRTVDYIDGETKGETKKRLDALDDLQEMVVESVENTLWKKIKIIKEKNKKKGK